MAVIDGSFVRAGNDPVQTGSLFSLLPSVALHGLVAGLIWLGFTQEPEVQPPVTFISLAPAATPAAAEPAPPAPSVPAPDLEPEFEPLPLPATGMALPQPSAEAAPAEPVLDFTPPELPELESFPFDPEATRPAEPEPEDAAPIEKVEEKPKPKAPEKPKAKPEKKQAKAKPKPDAKPKPKKETKKAAAPALPERKPAQAPARPAAAAPASPSTAKAAPAKTVASKTTQDAALSDAPVRVTNPNYAGACPISYPERARKRNQEGTVVVHALIGPDGKPIEVTVAQSSGHRLLDEAAQEAIAHCAFVPQQVGGRAVKAIVEIPIPFKLI
jgi:protein TonB